MRKYINLWTYWVLSCMSMLTWCGCSDEELLQDETKEKQETFRLTVSQEQKDKSRLAFNEDLLTTYWENGDKLYLYKVDDTTKQYTLQTELAKPSATAIFTCNEVLRGGTYYVVYNKSSILGTRIRFYRGNDSFSGYDYASDEVWLYGIITIETGQTSASIKLKPVHSMIKFSFNDPDGELPRGSKSIDYIGLFSPQIGFPMTVELQPDGSFKDIEPRMAKYEFEGRVFSNIENKTIEKAAGFLLPVDLTDKDVYFYIVYQDTYDENNRKELVYEFKKKGINLEAGVCYNVMLDLTKANKYDLSDRKLDCPGDFRALTYASTYCYEDPKKNYIYEYEVTQDIDFNGVEYFPIMPTDFFMINGKDHKLKNITINWPHEGAGLIAGNRCTVKNLTIENATINGKDYVGGFCGLGEENSFSNCKLINSTIKGDNYVGGIYGGSNSSSYNNYVSLSGCYVDGSQISGTGSSVGGAAGSPSSVSKTQVRNVTVKGVDYVGGIAGNVVGKISECTSAATVTASGHSVGGILGTTASIAVYSTSSGSAYRCANHGNVTGLESVGGIVGHATGGNPIDQCYSTGTIRGNNNVGGIVGYSGNYASGVYFVNPQPITNCYNLGKVTGEGTATAGICGLWTRPGNSAKRIENCYSAGDVFSGNGIVGDFPYTSKSDVTCLANCVTTSERLGEPLDANNEHADYTNLSDINSKIDIFDKAEVYFPNRVWDTTLYPYNCTILLWQGGSFGMEVTK